MAAELCDGHERLPVERDGAVGGAYGHGRVEEDEAVLLGERGDLGADLIGPLHVAVPDGPQMPARTHWRPPFPGKNSRVVTTRPMPPTIKLRKRSPLWMPWDTASV